MSMTPEQLQAWRWEREIDERNRPLSDEELDAMFPEGYKVITTRIWFLECGFAEERCTMRLVGYQFPVILGLRIDPGSESDKS